MKNFISAIILFTSLYGNTQDTTAVKQIIENYPHHFESVDKLAKRINSDFTLPKEKIRALYYWIATNIDFDSKNDLFNFKINFITYSDERDKKRQEKIKKEKRILKTLKTNKAVCLDYSELFKAVCNKIDVESEIVIGYSKIFINEISNERNYKDHAWNVVKVDDSWKLIDLTWASAYIKGLPTNIEVEFSDYYLFTNPDEFISTHFPIEEKWQLTTTKLSKFDFFNAPVFFPNYYKSGFKLVYPKDGTIDVLKKKIKIHFYDVPKNKNLYYSFQNGNQVKPLTIKRSKRGTYIASVKFRNESAKLTIYSDFMPILGFKINSLP